MSDKNSAVRYGMNNPKLERSALARSVEIIWGYFSGRRPFVGKLRCSA